MNDPSSPPNNPNADHTEPTDAERALLTPLPDWKSLGVQRGLPLWRLGLQTVADLLFYFPRDYEDLTDLRTCDSLEEGKLQTVVGRITDIDARSTRTGGWVIGVAVEDPTGGVRGLWFNQPHIQKRLTRGQRVMFSGKPKQEGLVWQMMHPAFRVLSEDDPATGGGVQPIYPLTEGVQQWHLRRLVRLALEEFADLLEEAIPPSLQQSRSLRPIHQSVRAIHFPEDLKDAASARERFVYQELLNLQLALALVRLQVREGGEAPKLEATAKIDARIRRRFPFELTGDQNQAIREIAADMAQAVPMNRLLQGDVGTGKTVVAVYAMLLAVAHGRQAAMMAPTEILARQHYRTLEKLLGESGVKLAILIGGMPTARRRELLEAIERGEIDLVVGTQAMLSEDVTIPSLGLVVIDEQHKFGVRQRAMLRESDLRPHYLVMTATPIPRTVTMTLFGDLDVSTIREMPPGRQDVGTYLVEPDKRDRWWKFFGDKLREGRQGFVIAPLVDPSETSADVMSAEEMFEDLSNGVLADFRVGLVHGRMTADEKDAVMADFRDGKLQVLVGTSVVEVGVDVPNATVMTIESAQRFGLAQLHQLRGRISRGKTPGFCGVFSDTDNEIALKRLEAFTGTRDGFKLAEIDFEIRGPGDMLGTRQHGLPPLRVADLIRDAKQVELARKDAAELIETDPTLEKPEHQRLKRLTLGRYGKVFDLGDVG